MATLPNFLLKRVGSLGLALALLGSVGLSITGCKKDSTEQIDQDAVANVKVATSATLGPYLTDANGNTLYIFARDVDGTNACTSATCMPLWPVYYEADIKVPKALNAADFATKTTTDGRQQTTYKGWPLYYYAPATGGVYTREAPGATGGNAIGGIWHVVNPSYGVALASKTVEDKTTHVVASKTFLVDGKGRTLYYFAKDNTSPGTQPTNCTSGCAAIWPALYMSAPAVPSTLRATDFATITRDPSTTTGPYGTTTSTREQLTYKGHPLYYYAGDNATRGHVEGHNLNDSGDFWFVAAP
ncbi:COG4315 family predicted lipoprotein [Hymenobacter daeguensis]